MPTRARRARRSASGSCTGSAAAPASGAILLATIDNRALAVGGLVVLAAFTAVSMTVLTTGFGFDACAAPRAAIAHAG